MLMQLAQNEDGSMPGEPLGFLEGFLWFFITPLSITLLIWVLVVALENVKRGKKTDQKSDVITRINE